MGDATQNVIFKIGTVGVSAGAQDLLKFAGAFAAVRAGINYVKSDLLPLSKIYSRMTDEQLQAADALGKSTGGLLDTVQQFQLVVKLSQAGISNYKTLAESAGKVIIDYSQRMGESQEQAGARLNQVFDAIIKGSPLAARMMREYGINVDVTGKSIDEVRQKFTEAFVEKAKEVETNTTSMDEALRAFNNTLGDAPAAMTALITNTDALNTVLGSTANLLTQLRSSFLAVPDVGASFSGFVASMIEDLGSLLTALIGPLSLLNIITGGGAADSLNNILPDDVKAILEKSRQAAYTSAKAQKSRKDRSAVTVDEMVFTEDEVYGKKKKGKGGKREALKANTFDDMLSSFFPKGDQPSAYANYDYSGSASEILGDLDAEAIRDAASAMRLFNETQAQRIELLQVKVQLLQDDPESMTLAEKQELWEYEIEHEEIMRQYQDERLKYLELRTHKEETFAKSFKDAWATAGEGVKAGSLAANAAMGVLEGTISNVISTLVQGGHVSGKVIARMVRDIAIGSSIQATVMGLLELVKAAIAYAAPFGAGSAQGAKHTAAAGEAFALAAVMAGMAVISNAAAGGYGGSRGGGSGGGYTGTAASSVNTIAPSSEPVNINNVIYLDGDPVYKSVEKRAISRQQQGQRGLQVANR